MKKKHPTQAYFSPNFFFFNLLCSEKKNIDGNLFNTEMPLRLKGGAGGGRRREEQRL
jgi:hypothetical protein